MNFISELIDDLWEALKDVFQSSKERYEGSSRFGRWRIWVLMALILDFAVVAGLFVFLGLRAIDVEAWYQPAFPSNLVILENSGSKLGPTEIVLDERYTLTAEEIPRGVNGFELERRFRDSSDARPSASYHPQRMRVTTNGESIEVEVRSSK